jgi:MOSC domain-containing protein
MKGIVKDILLAEKAGDPLSSTQSAELQAEKGIVGDRYYLSQGTFSRVLEDLPDFEVTLIEQEQIDSFNTVTGLAYAGADFRRNIVTKNVQLNELVGKEFFVGKVKLRGIRLCEPCTHLSAMIGDEVLEHMAQKAGLRAQIIISGEIYSSDSIICENGG